MMRGESGERRYKRDTIVHFPGLICKLHMLIYILGLSRDTERMIDK
jgi:hypothetical protein